MPRRLVIFLAGLLLVAIATASWWGLHRPPQRVNASEFENEMTAGLLRGLVRELATNNPPPVCFVAFGEGRTPATHAFMARFANSYPALRSAQASVSPPIGQHFEVSNGRPGLILRLVRTQEITPSAYDVVVAFSNLPGGNDRFVYRVTKFAGEWNISGRRLE